MNGGAPAQALPELERAVELRPDERPLSRQPRLGAPRAASGGRLHRALPPRDRARPQPRLRPTSPGERAHRTGRPRRRDRQLPARRGARSGGPRRAQQPDPGGAHRLRATTRRSWATRRGRGPSSTPSRCARTSGPTRTTADLERPLRIGYVSPDLRAHPVRHFLWPLLRHHDRSAFDVYLYASVEREDAATDAYRAWAGETFRDIRRMDDVSAAELVRSDRIDILVDLAVHGAGHRLRLLRVQAGAHPDDLARLRGDDRPRHHRLPDRRSFHRPPGDRSRRLRGGHRPPARDLLVLRPPRRRPAGGAAPGAGGRLRHVRLPGQPAEGAA